MALDARIHASIRELPDGAWDTLDGVPARRHPVHADDRAAPGRRQLHSPINDNSTSPSVSLVDCFVFVVVVVLIVVVALSFQIRYSNDADYEPDFVVETETEKLICEPKSADRMQDPVVLAKARAAATWCKHATAHEEANHGKPWRYLLIPHGAIADNMTLDGLAKQFTVAAPEEGK